MTLELRVELSGRLAGVATVVNAGEDTRRLWRPGSELGDAPWRFELSNGACYFSDDVYTRDAPVAAEVRPGESLSRPFDLLDGTWRADGDLGDAAELTAVYEVPMTPEAAEQGVWVGTLRSAPVPL